VREKEASFGGGELKLAGGRGHFFFLPRHNWLVIFHFLGWKQKGERVAGRVASYLNDLQDHSTIFYPHMRAYT
jgi:hypothetical protein